jgi:hypothetical protein
MTQSTPICVANLIFSAACWSDGSAVATIRRLLRLLRTTIGRPGRSWDRAGPWAGAAVDGVEVEQGAPNALDMVCARSAADTAPEPVSSAMKLVRPLSDF